MDMVLSVENAEKYYGREPNLKKALDRVDFEVSAGEFVSIMGPSGSGKTTLLNCISTIDTIDAGHIYLGSQDLASLPQQKSARFRQENLGFIFQDFNLLDTLSIEENIALPLAVKDIPAKEIKSTVRRASPYSTPRGAGTPSNTTSTCRTPTRATTGAEPSPYGRWTGGTSRQSRNGSPTGLARWRATALPGC